MPRDLQAIAKGSWEFHAGPWDRVSPEAKAVVKGLLEANPEKRTTVAALLEAPWVAGAFEALSRASLGKISELNAQNLANISWAFAKARSFVVLV